MPVSTSTTVNSTKRSVVNPTSRSSSNKRQKLSSSSSSSTFSALKLSHPLGIKPSGNSFLATSSARPGLGYFQLYSDDLILHFLSYLSFEQLLSLSLLSHAFHVFTNQDHLWKDIYISTFKGALDSWEGDWKNTFLTKQRGRGTGERNLEHDCQEPIRTPDLYSDTLFHNFRMSFSPLSVVYSQDYPSASNNNHSKNHLPIKRIKVKDYSISKFTQEFAQLSIPCIMISNSIDSNPQKNRSCLSYTFDSLSTKYPTNIFRAEAITTDLKTYIQYSRSCETHFKRGRGIQPSSLRPPIPISKSNRPFNPYAIPDDSPFYLFDSKFPEEMDKQGEWLIPDLLEFSREVGVGEGDEETGKEKEKERSRMEMDLFGLLGNERPEYRWIIAGPERSGSGVSSSRGRGRERRVKESMCIT